MISKKKEIKKEEVEVMQDKIERIVYYLEDIESQWEMRPYIIWEDMTIVFGILDIDGITIHEINDKKAMEYGWSKKFLWEIAKKNTEIL